MFWNNPKNQEKIYKFVNDTEKLESKIQILPVNFEKPWWDLILKQKRALILMLSSEIFGNVFIVIFPILIGLAITNNNFILFSVIILMMFFDTWTNNFIVKIQNIAQINCMKSVEYRANEYFLTVDPIAHSTQSSGQIISKITQGASGYEDILDLLGSEILAIVVSFITVSIALFVFDWQIGLVSFLLLIIIGSFNILFNLLRTSIFLPKQIISRDKLSAVSVETLLQAPFIRAIYATNEQIQRLSKATRNHMVNFGNNWQAYQYVSGTSRSLHIISVFVIGKMVFDQMQNGAFTPILAISIFLTYANGTQSILTIGAKIKKLSTAIANINDLFDFIRGFGKQTFPVLDEDKQWQSANTTKTIPS